MSNIQTIYQAIKDHGKPITLDELVDKTKIYRPDIVNTVSKIICDRSAKYPGIKKRSVAKSDYSKQAFQRRKFKVTYWYQEDETNKLSGEK